MPGEINQIDSPNKVSYRIAVTLTIKPKCLERMSSAEMFDKFICNVTDDLLRRCEQVSLVCELMQDGKIHYHGTVTITYEDHAITEYQDWLRKHPFFGKFMCKEITDESGWITYISKEIKENYIKIKKRCILIDDFNYWGDDEWSDYKQDVSDHPRRNRFVQAKFSSEALRPKFVKEEKVQLLKPKLNNRIYLF